MSETYTVIMMGKVADGQVMDEVKARVAKMFKLDGAQLDKMFSGKAVAVRRGVDRQQADKICAALLNAGAVAKVKADIPAADQQAQELQASPQPESLSREPESAPEPAAVSTDTEDFTPDIECPRCGHEQAFTTQCGLCKMDLTLHIKRLQRKERVRAHRRELMAHAAG